MAERDCGGIKTLTTKNSNSRLIFRFDLNPRLGGDFFRPAFLYLYIFTTFLKISKNMARLNLLEETRYEKLPVTVYRNQKEASLAVAGRIASLIRKKSEKGEKAVLGLATGVTPIGVYAELVRCQCDHFQP
jgi:hypothetical protein